MDSPVNIDQNAGNQVRDSKIPQTLQRNSRIFKLTISSSEQFVYAPPINDFSKKALIWLSALYSSSPSFYKKLKHGIAYKTAGANC